MGMSSDHYHTHKDVLCWDCNNLIKNINENAIVWGGNPKGKVDCLHLKRL